MDGENSPHLSSSEKRRRSKSPKYVHQPSASTPSSNLSENVFIKQEKIEPEDEVKLKLASATENIEGLQLLTVAGVKLGAEKSTIVTAFLLFHRYLSQAKSDKEKYDQMLLLQDILAATSYYVSGKVNEDANFDLDDIVNVFYVLCNREAGALALSDPKFVELRETIIRFEIKLLQRIQFNLRIEVPHYYLLNYLKYLSGISSAGKVKTATFCKSAVRVLDDFYYNPKCIEYDAESIAIAVLMFIMKTVPLPLQPGQPTAAVHWARFFAGSAENLCLYRAIELEIINTYSLV